MSRRVKFFWVLAMEGHAGCCNSSSHSHSHEHDSVEFDPCMAQEIANMERNRRLYEKYKTQSDKFLMGLNIRLDQGRTRGAVKPDEQEGSESESDGVHESSLIAHLVMVKPVEWNEFVKNQSGKRIILLVMSCDYIPPTELDRSSSGDFAEVASIIHSQLVSKKIKDVSVAQFSKPVCVCGKCDDIERRVGGSLRSLTLLLRERLSVVVLRSGGLLGMWSSTDGPLDSFISKYL